MRRAPFRAPSGTERPQLAAAASPRSARAAQGEARCVQRPIRSGAGPPRRPRAVCMGVASVLRGWLRCAVATRVLNSISSVPTDGDVPLGSARRTSRLRADAAHTHGSPRRPSHPATLRDTGRPATSSGMASAAGRPDVGISGPVRGPVVRHLTEGRFCALRDRDLTPCGLCQPGRFGPDRSCRQIDVAPRELYYPTKICQHRRPFCALKSVIYQRSPVFMCVLRPDGGAENSCQPLASLIGRERDHGKNWLVHDSQG